MQNKLADIKTKLIACAVVAEELRAKLPVGIDCETLDFGLHRTPEKLKATLQEAIDKSQGYKNIVLAYGLCGMSVIGLHSDSTNLIVPKVDDCIAMFLGSRNAYLQRQAEYPGTLFLSKGWIEGKIDDTSPDEAIYQDLLTRYSEEKAKRLLSVYKSRNPLRHYKRMAFIKTSNESDLEQYKEIARSRALKLGLIYEEISGSSTFMEKIIDGHWDGEFIVAGPGHQISFNDFWQDAEKTPLPYGTVPSIIK
jgi:hypothetical protein